MAFFRLVAEGQRENAGVRRLKNASPYVKIVNALRFAFEANHRSGCFYMTRSRACYRADIGKRESNGAPLI